MRRERPYELSTARCSIERSLSLLGDGWTFLVLRQAHAGTTRFVDFQARLGVAPDVLSMRLNKLVDAGVLEKREYRTPGERTRLDYHLTDAGVSLRIVLGALQQWGDEHLPLLQGPTYQRRDRRTGRPVEVSFVNDHGDLVAPGDVTIAAPVPRPAA